MVVVMAYKEVVLILGSAGCVVARRLAEVQDWKILLIEAGENPLALSDIPLRYVEMFGTQMDWNYLTEPQSHGCLGMNEQRCLYKQGKAMGGTSAFNGMEFVRGNAADFDEWESMGNPGWGYKDVLEFFKKYENATDQTLSPKYHGRDGPQPVSLFGVSDIRLTPYRDRIREAVEELGYTYGGDYNGAIQTGFAPMYGSVFGGERANTARYFLKAGALENLVVSKLSLAEKVIVKNGKAVGVKYTRGGRTITVVSRKEVIVSAGALNSPQVLMLSGIGPEDHLKDLGIEVVKNIPGVGENFHDHYLAGSNVYKLKPVGECLDMEVAGDEYNFNRTGALAGVNLFSVVVGFIDTKQSFNLPDNQFGPSFACAKQYTDITDSLTAGNVKASIVDLYKEALKGYDVISFSNFNLKPESRGTIRLKDRNPTTPPLIDPNIYGDERDVQAMVRGAREVLRIMNTTAFKDLEPELVDVDVEECRGFKKGSDERMACFIRLLSITTYHYSGSCKMGPASDNMAVVDARLRVHGVKGLRVIDNSIMPKVTRGNTNAPAIMIGERGAFLIREDYDKV